MAQNVHYHFRTGKELSEEVLDQSKTDTQQGKLQILHLRVWCPRALQISNSFQLWCLQHTSVSWTASVLFAVLFGRYHRALASPTLRGLQRSPHFIFSASYSGLSGPTCRYSPVTHLASTSFLNTGGRFYNLFTWVFLPLKPELSRRHYQVLLHSLGWGLGLPWTTFA